MASYVPFLFLVFILLLCACNDPRVGLGHSDGPDRPIKSAHLNDRLFVQPNWYIFHVIKAWHQNSLTGQAIYPESQYKTEYTSAITQASHKSNPLL